jgi:hypothetical protein
VGKIARLGTRAKLIAGNRTALYETLGKEQNDVGLVH